MSKIFFAGASSEGLLPVLKWAKVKQVLMSYFALRKKKIGKAIALIENVIQSGMELMLDSGAFSYISKARKTLGFLKTSDEAEAESYFNSYLQFLLEVKRLGLPIIPVEFDIHFLLPNKQNKFRFRKALLDAGLNVLPVWHFEDGFAHFQGLCREFDWVGPGGSFLRSASFSNTIVSSLFAEARKQQTRLALFGTTHYSCLLVYPYFSCDSLRWASGSLYGETHIYLPARRTLLVYSKSEKNYARNLSKRVLEIAHNPRINEIDWQAVRKDVGTEVNKLNLLHWIDFQGAIDKEQQRRKTQYWKEQTNERMG